MADVFKVEGFEELNRKLKLLPERVKRTEVLKIQRRLAKPIIEKYKNELPADSGTLGRSVKADTVPARKADGNPAIAVRPSKKGKDDGYYKFMVIPKGKKTGSTKRGSRKGFNTVVGQARDRVLASIGPQTYKKALEDTAAYIQKQIDKLGSL